MMSAAALITYYVAIPFSISDDGSIVAGEPQECRDAGKARRVAAVLASDPHNCGAIAFSRSGDPALGDFEDAVIISKIGEVDGAAL
jgi:hypothetical protein